ncbi:VanZ family protein [Clostridium baratii]
MQKYRNKIIYSLFAVIISQIICYYFLDQLFNSLCLLSSNVSLILLRVSVAISLYSFINILFRRRVLKKDIDILFLAYTILVINITVFKEYGLLDLGYYNLNIFDLIRDMGSINSVVMAIGNIGAYIPIGVYIIHRFKHSNRVNSIIAFIIYIFIGEIVQYIFKLGAFDINDIILNTMGFYLGISCKIDNINIKNFKEALKNNMSPMMVFFNMCIFFIMIYSVNSNSYQFFIIYIFTGILNRKAIDKCEKSFDRIVITISIIISVVLFMAYSSYVYNIRIKEIASNICELNILRV